MPIDRCMSGGVDELDPAVRARIERCANALLAAWARPSLTAWPDNDDVPRNIAEAQAVAASVAARCGLSPAGWKIAGTDPAVRARLGLDDLFFGRLFAERLLASPAVVTAGTGGAVLEVELGVRIGGGRRDGPDGLVAALAPCLEVPAIHVSGEAGGGLMLVADNGGGSGAVVGLDSDPVALGGDGTAPVRVRIESADGAVTAHLGTASLARARAAVAWLAEAAPGGLQPGDVVLTGALTGVHLLSPGDVLTADFGAALGSVSVAVEGV